MLKKCEFCKQDFLNTKTGTKKFCSVKCRDKFRWWDRKRVNYVKEFTPNKCECVYCGKIFINTNHRKPSGRKYCDSKCLKRDWRRNNQEVDKEHQRRVTEKRKNDPLRNKDFIEKTRLMNQSFNGKLRRYKYNAKLRNLEFSLTVEEFRNFWGRNCYYCDDSIKTIGIDRIESDKGYSTKNCIPCCAMCNRMKMKYSVDDFIKKCIEISNNFKNKNTI